MLQRNRLKMLRCGPLRQILCRNQMSGFLGQEQKWLTRAGYDAIDSERPCGRRAAWRVLPAALLPASAHLQLGPEALKAAQSGRLAGQGCRFK